jgi:hypothetical protein
MVQVRYKKKNEELSAEQLRSRIADGSLRRGAKVRSAEHFGDDRWHDIEMTTEWCQVAPIWHIPPPGPHLAKTALLTLTIVFGAAGGLLRLGVSSYESPAWAPMFLLQLGSVIVWMMVVHGMWKSIRGSFSSTTPGDAVVGFFFPFYNLYWLFAGHTGFVKNYNLVATLLRDRFGKSPAPLRMWPFVVYPVVFLVWAVTFRLAPVAAVFIELAVVASRAVLIARACDAVNALHVLRRDSPDVAQA